MIFHSIRWRILAWNFALLAATAAVLLFAFYGHEQRSWLQEMDLRLRREMTRGMGAIGEVVPGVVGPRGPAAPLARPNAKSAPRGDSPEQRSTKARQALLEIAEAGIWVQAVDSEGKTLYRSSYAPTDPALVTQALAELAEPPADGPARPQDLIVSLPGHRVLLHRPPGRNLVMFGASTAQLDANLAALGRRLALAGFAVVFVGCGIGWLLAGRSLRPIDHRGGRRGHRGRRLWPQDRRRRHRERARPARGGAE